MIKKLKANFTRHGSPCQFVSDNGPQLVAAELHKFIRDWDVKRIPTYPHNSKANGKVEAVVKSARRLLRKTAKGGEDFYLGFLSERNIPSQGFGNSPVQRPINGETRTLRPTTGNLLEPRNLNTSHEREKLRDEQKKASLFLQ